MTLDALTTIVLLIALSLIAALWRVKEKNLTHIIFMVFCASVAVSKLHMLTADIVGNFKYLIAVGTAATCNGYWLLARALFRRKNPIQKQHLMLAGAVSALIILSQGSQFAGAVALISEGASNATRHVIREFTLLLSSSVLVLAAWEGLNGYSRANAEEKRLRQLFVVTLISAVAFSKTPVQLISDNPEARDYLISVITICVLINTFIVVMWRQRMQEALLAELANKDNDDDVALVANIRQLLIEQQLFLQPNLKVGDVAKALDLPEYRVSNAIREHLEVKNFNQLVNELRVEHAKSLLENPANKQWTVLVVGLESGFASVGPFTRAFKAFTGQTPNQYRQAAL